MMDWIPGRRGHSLPVLVLKMGKTWAYAFILFLLVNWPTQVEDELSVSVPLKGFEEKITQGGVLSMI